MSHRVAHEHGLSLPHSFAVSLSHLFLGPSRLLCSLQTIVFASRLQASLCVSVCVCVCVCVCCVYSLSFLASPNNSHTVINIVWRSLWPAVSGPAAQGSGSDADEWPHTHTHTHTHTKLSVVPSAFSELLPSQRPRPAAPNCPLNCSRAHFCSYTVYCSVFLVNVPI